MSEQSINLVNLMSEFYSQIAQIKVWIEGGKLASEVVAILKTDSMPSDSEMAAAISVLLNQWVARKQLAYQSNLTDMERQLFDRAIYAMVALADELFIMELDWPGKAHWQEVLLEEQLYQSCSAGVGFFHAVDELLADGNYDALERELAVVYLLVLRLGFQGRYRGDEQKMSDYRDKLFNIVNRAQNPSDQFISEQAYEQCLISEQEQRLAPLANWYRGIVWGGVIYLLAGAGMWFSLTWALNQWMGS